MSIIDGIGSVVKPDSATEFLLDEDGFAEEYPGLFEILARHRYKGKDRTTGRLILFAEPGRASVCLCDKHSGQVCFYTSGTFSEALEGIERALREGKADWRQDKRTKSGRSWG